MLTTTDLKHGLLDDFAPKGLELPPVLSPELAEALARVEGLSPEEAARDEALWTEVRKAFLTSPELINLNVGGVCPQPICVQEAEYQLTRFINLAPAYQMWWVLEDGREVARRRLSELAGCDPEELAILRNTTEALDNVINNLPLQAGDEVVVTNQDYPNMKAAWRNREGKDGIVLNWVDLKMPSANDDELAAGYTRHFGPKTKATSITHMVHWTGQVNPIRRIADNAREQGIVAIGDCSHTFCHLDYTFPELGLDYAGTSLHKWLSAPFGTGLLYVPKENIPKLRPLMPFRDLDPTGDDIRKFEGQGTRAYAAELAIPHAVDFQQAIGNQRKQARLRYLTRYWAEQAAAQIPGIRFHTPLNGEHHAALNLFSIEGVDKQVIMDRLMDEFNISVVAFEAPLVDGIRVSPHIFTALAELDRLLEGLHTIARDR